jgi:hypothetical protein
MQWNRDQYLALMCFGDFPRPMFVEPFGLLLGLEAEWRQQGATDDEIDLTAFDFDYVACESAGGNCGPIGLPDTQIVSEDEAFRIERDGLGRILQIDKRTATIALPTTFPVADMDDWRKIRRHWAFDESRIDEQQVARAIAAREQGYLIRAYIPGAYDTLRNLMGEEAAAIACYDQPELVDDVLRTLRETAMAVLQRITERLTIDQLSTHEDMAGRSGPLFGPTQMQRFVKPYFRPVWDMLAARGTRIFDMDTDGNVNAILDDLLDCGINHLHPMEPAAGMDIVATRQQYGQRLTFLGGIDKFALARGRDAIDQELAYKLQPLLRDGGGVAFGLDHRIPNGTPLTDYRYYVDTARQILGIPPRDPARKGWARMAM